MAKSKQQQWINACSEAEAAIQKLLDIQTDCQEKYEEMSKKEQEEEEGGVLDDICSLDIQGAMDTIQEAAGANIP